MTSVDRARFADASRALLSLAKQPDSEQACLLALDRILDLLGLDRAALLIPEGEGMCVHGRGIPQELLDKMASSHVGLASGTNRYRYVRLQRMMRSLHERRCFVWDMPLAERVSGISREEHAFYHEVAAPAGLVHSSAAAVPLPRGKAILGIGYDDPEDGRFGEERLALLRMLLPALEGGLRARGSFAHRQAALAGVLDGLSEGTVIFDMDGGELYRNRALQELLAEDPRRDTLVAVMRVSAERLVALQRGRRGKTAPPQVPAPGKQTVETDVSSYAIRASYLAPGTFTGDEAVVVTLERSLPALPSPEELRRRFGLTPRQAEVALLAARGHTNDEIAERLTRSPHTVRHHLEHIFARLGVRTRKALGLRLLAGTGR